MIVRLHTRGTIIKSIKRKKIYKEEEIERITIWESTLLPKCIKKNKMRVLYFLNDIDAHS